MNARVLLDRPTWFAAVMGTGAVAVVAEADPAAGMLPPVVGVTVAWSLFGLAAAFFGFLLVRNVVVRRLYRGVGQRLRSPETGADYATFPGAICVLALGLVRLTDPGAAAPLWWLVAGLATIGTTLGLLLTVVFFTAMFEQDEFEAEDISGTWFVPVTVILIGAILGADLANGAGGGMQRTVTVVSFALLGIGLVLFALTMMLFFNRLVLHRQSERVGAPAMWILLSPLSVAALALQNVAADTALVAGMDPLVVLQTAHWMAVILWGFSLWWLAVAAVITKHVGRAALTRTPSDWAFVFPTAALTLATITLAGFWQSGVVAALGFGFSLGLLAIWGTVFASSAITLATDPGTE